MDDIQGDIAGLFPDRSLSRRGFVMTSLASGFALSVQPAGATIVTDSGGLTAGEVQIATIDGDMPAYRAMPQIGAPFPVVLVVEEVFGVHEHIKDMCRRFAKKGYMAVAPELYARIGDPGKLTDIGAVIALVNKLPDQQAFADLDVTANWAWKHGGSPDKIGITGFCRGGRMAWMYAAHNPHLKCGVAWYGPLTGGPTAEMPTNPVDVAGTIKVPMLGLYGGKDQGISQADIDEMKQRLKAAGDDTKFIVYPDAGHGFNADYRPSYDEAAAKDGFAQCLNWFRNYGLL